MSDDTKPTITLAPDGPYLVKEFDNLSNRHGPIETKPTMALCRCGASENKPFCDGTHSRIGFSSAKLDDRTEDRRDSYEGREITIHDNRGVCAHAGYCTDRLPSVFRMKQEPWIDPDGASRDEIAELVESCPSGALSHSVDGVERPQRAEPPSVFVSPNGPYVVKGAPELAATLGEGASADRVTLCRCGGSKNKPFCDGSHWNLKFTDDDN